MHNTIKNDDEPEPKGSQPRPRIVLDASEGGLSPEEWISRIKDGTISAPLNTLVSCYGGQPAEAVLRGMYYSGRLELRHGLRFPMAVAMEDQTLPLGLASLFAGSS